MNGYVHNEIGTYSVVDPTDLCLELCETHEQNYIVFPPIAPLPLVAHPFRSPRSPEVWCTRSAGDVDVNTTQYFELVFSPLSAITRCQGELKTLPGSTSFHSGLAKAPVYLMISGEVCCGEMSSVIA